MMLVLGLVSCRKEIMAPDEAAHTELVRNYVHKQVDEATYGQLSWSQAEPIESDGVVVGYKIPFSSQEPLQYDFVLVDAPGGRMKGVYRNDITYSQRPEGLFPESVVNYHFQSGERHAYSTRSLLSPNLPGIQLSAKLEEQARDFRVPAVTAIGIYENDGTEAKPATIREIRTYLLAYLLGLDAGGLRGRVLKEVPHGIHFYNPRYDVEKDQNPALIEWEIGR
ncbi:MAG: hypothetical protein MUF29_03155 [Chitinophagaceae bacterium]|nr:hypothetical protein [Chitinophagaceae bacterium]